MLARRLIAPLLGVLLAAALLPSTWGLDAVARGLGPGFWPRVALVGLGLACVMHGVAQWRRKIPITGSPHPAIDLGQLAAGVALILGYVLLTPLAGFPLVTALFIAAFMALCGARSITMIAANVVIGTAALLYLFVKLVYLPLPKGDGPFEALTLALYRALRLF